MPSPIVVIESLPPLNVASPVTPEEAFEIAEHLLANIPYDEDYSASDAKSIQARIGKNTLLLVSGFVQTKRPKQILGSAEFTEAKLDGSMAEGRLTLYRNTLKKPTTKHVIKQDFCQEILLPFRSWLHVEMLQ